jgi:hypothetical protein
MGVAFEIEVTPSLSVLRWCAGVAAVPTLALAVCAWQLSAGPTWLIEGPALLRLGLAGVLSIGAVWVPTGLWLAVRRRQIGGGCGLTLIVDADGRPTVRAPGLPPVAMTLRASCALPGLTWLHLAPYPRDPAQGHRRAPVSLLIGADAASPDRWRRLRVWLRWLERGRQDRSDLGSDSR